MAGIDSFQQSGLKTSLPNRLQRPKKTEGLNSDEANFDWDVMESAC